MSRKGECQIEKDYNVKAQMLKVREIHTAEYICTLDLIKN
jgi:hypothetical protein